MKISSSSYPFLCFWVTLNSFSKTWKTQFNSKRLCYLNTCSIPLPVSKKSFSEFENFCMVYLAQLEKHLLQICTKMLN